MRLNASIGLPVTQMIGAAKIALPSDVLRIGQRVLERKEDVRVEDRERMMQERVHVPAERPDVEVGVRPDREHACRRMQAVRIRHDERERGVQQEKTPGIIFRVS